MPKIEEIGVKKYRNRRNKVYRVPKKVVKAFKKKLGLRRVDYRATMNSGQRIRGRGDYSIANVASKVIAPFRDSTSSVGLINKGARSIGEIIGNEIPIPGAGRALGNAASWLSRAFGFGDYAIRNNSFTNGNIAQFANHGTIEFAHREFITDISSTTGFQNTAYPINPGNSTLFPWLSTLAKNFEQYEMLGLIFEFKSTSATAVGSVNTGLGTVIMATDYDVLDNPYVDKRSMEVSEFSTSAAPFLSQIHPIECDPKQNVMKNLFIQPGNQITAYPDDPRFSAMGNFQIATSGMQAVSVIGELWVSYHVRLYKPQLEQGTLSTTSLHAAYSTLLNSAPQLNGSLITNNPGAITLTTAASRAVFTCATHAGIGTYHVSTCVINSIFSGGMNYPVGAAGVPIFTGLAGYHANAWDYATGVPGIRNAGFENLSYNDNNGMLASGYNPTSQTWLLTFKAVGDSISLAVPGNISSTVYCDIYWTPYQAPNLTTPKSEFSKVQAELDFLRKSNKDIIDRFSKLEVVEEEEPSSDVVVDAAINTLKKEVVEAYSQRDCEERIDSISDLLECSLMESQTSFLTARLKSILARHRSITSR